MSYYIPDLRTLALSLSTAVSGRERVAIVDHIALLHFIPYIYILQKCNHVQAQGSSARRDRPVRP
jgi:hypothetical protein